MSKYECHCCNYKTSRKHDFHKHMGTKRHFRNSQNKEFIPKSENSQPATNLRVFSPPKSSKILQNPLICEKVAKISLQNPPKSSEILLPRLFSEKTQLFQKKVLKIHKIYIFFHILHKIYKKYINLHIIYIFLHILHKIYILYLRMI